MFKRLELVNFRKHEHLQLAFEPGLIAIRGRSEVGKTTIQEAIAYAMFGSGALRQSFAEVVTYDKPESSLVVSLELTNGMSIHRRKAGAEVRTLDKVVVTGQKEVTRYVEALLGASGDVAAKLMLARQNELRGALEGGPSEAAQMIEKLADFDLIDRVVGLITEHLPTGNTAAIEASLKSAEEQLEAHVMPDFDAAAAAAQESYQNTLLGLTYERQRVFADELAKLDVAGARRFMVELANLGRDEAALAPQIERARAAAAVEIAEPATSAAQLQALQAEQAGQAVAEARRRAWSAYEGLTQVYEPDLIWDNSRTDFEAERLRLRTMYEAEAAAKQDLTMRKQAAMLRRISEKQCAFCSKDLSEVPEVILRNTESDNEVRRITEKIGLCNITLNGLSASLEEMNQLHTEARAYEERGAKLGPYVTTCDDRYPVRFEWIGDPPDMNPDVVDLPALIASATAAHAAYQRAVGARDAAAASLKGLEGQAAGIRELLAKLLLEQPAVAERIVEGEKLERQISACTDQIAEQRTTLQSLRSKIDYMGNLREQAELQRAGYQKAVDYGRDLLKRLQFNNALLKRVRAARPAIADKLWTIVLAAVSHHFSQIRGVQSVITRSDNGFRCDGQPVAGLSGSTLDSLGLAIRIALTKTFLPNSSMMMLDEPGAAMDPEREANMLGLVAASGFDQILLITHSELADSFAAQVVRL